MKKNEEELIEQLADQRRSAATSINAIKDGPSLMERMSGMKHGEIMEITGDEFEQIMNDDIDPFKLAHTPAQDHKGPVDNTDFEPHENAGGSTPEQYALPEGARELQDLIEHRNMNFAVGNVFKACYRKGTCSHSDERRDLRKMIWFAKRELARLG